MVAGRVFVPIRETGEQLGAKISWNQKTKTASIEKDGNKLVAKVGP
ncbi:stalk domain-containing protein [Paenibacillus sp. YAF4_2]